ncbi:alpha-L-arabinofuranosidase C-terminal domain-containing protein [Terriglobus aquaticus]|uniref:non-reducing end alpha-L-arabinofuranosidase n=1 Tax=Terriglobus aquaticus TaxID=940139 RepID=A0ABW9KJ64_9BACT|nr:alpha-L-arabinofuranosidase C-terminal domain-containing protein [Terriglobus aquaticus]
MRFSPLCCAALSLGSFVAAAAFAQQAPATITIQADKPLHKVSPMLYGLMTEEINYSYDGGLYAEMVRNRTFEHDWSGFEHWTLVEQGTGRARFEGSRTDGPTVDLPSSLHLTVSAADAQNPAGIRNDGYWGMAVRPDTTYTGSIFAHVVDGTPGVLTVSLVNDNTGKVLATTTTQQLNGDWKQYQYVLKTDKLPAGSVGSQNHLQFTLTSPGTVDLQLPSLFPPTYKNRANGNRADLMDMLAGMHPHFLRMPGGNYLEGDVPEERFNWKATLGPLQNRPTHRSPWNYTSTDGMGLLEFLEWTEDLNIEPVLAVYAGYSLKGAHINAGAALKPYVDDALDEIEFVTGDQNTKWGAIRTQLGHPKPFPLHYVEIGNEDEFDRSGSYDGRYKQFYGAIKQAYPQLQLIATTPVKSMTPDVIDDHYYKQSGEFYAMLNHYDTMDRNGPKIFVGEWATREGSPTTNAGAMLGDAAFMTSMERNSDLIVMASYAPLFVNVNPGGMQWSGDLIGYDAMTSYGAPSYYAQALFSQYLGTDVPESQKSGGSDRVFYSVTTDAAKGKIFLKLVNGTTTPQPVQLQINGAKLAREAQVETLSAATQAETNSITDPRRIVPVHSVLKGVNGNLQHTLPPLTVQVITFSM